MSIISMKQQQQLRYIDTDEDENEQFHDLPKRQDFNEDNEEEGEEEEGEFEREDDINDYDQEEEDEEEEDEDAFEKYKQQIMGEDTDN